jgi:MFS family permease
MQTIAQNWLVYRLTGSPAGLGIMNGLSILPLFPLALFGGSLADRFPRRWLIVITQSLMMFQAFLLAWLTWSGHVQVWHVWVMAMLLAAFQMLDVPARQAFVVEMVGEEDLGNAIALNSSLFNFARIIGPSLAGLVVATLGEAMAFFLKRRFVPRGDRRSAGHAAARLNGPACPRGLRFGSPGRAGSHPSGCHVVGPGEHGRGVRFPVHALYHPSARFRPHLPLGQRGAGGGAPLRAGRREPMG